MFTETTSEQLRTIAKQKGTTLAALTEALVKYALESGVDVETLSLKPALKRGRKPGVKVPDVEHPVGEENPS